jgi:hypothetical protein
MALSDGRRPRRPQDGPDLRATPERVSFPRGTWVLLGVFGVFFAATLGGQFLLIKQQRDLAVQQRNVAVTTQGLLDPFLDDARPLAERTRRRLPDVEAAARRADRLTRSATPLVRELDDAGLPEATRKAGTVFDALLTGDLPRTLAAVDEAATTLNDRDRLSRLLRSTITVLGTVRTTGLVQRAADATRVVARLDRTQDRALDILTETLELQRQALAVTRQTLAVARRTEGHAASLDRKLGGQLPAVSRGRP